MNEKEKVVEKIEKEVSKHPGIEMHYQISPDFFENEIWISFNLKNETSIGSEIVDDLVRDFNLDYFPTTDGLAGAGFWANDGEMEINFKKVFTE